MRKITKKLASILLTILTTSVILSASAIPSTFAAEEAPAKPKTPSVADTLLPTPEVKVNPSSDKEATEASIKNKLDTYKNLPKASLNQLFTTSIKTVLFIAGSLLTIGLVVAGIMFLTSSGNEENQTKAKKMLTYLGIGIAIISVSYALISGIMQINLFK